MFIHFYCCLGAVIGTVVCSLFNSEEPLGPGYSGSSDGSFRHQHSTYYPPHPSNNNRKSKTKKSKGIIF